MDERPRDFLPPEPQGPEPDLGAPPEPREPEPGPGPPADVQPSPEQQPPPAQPQAPPPAPGWQPPPQQWQQGWQQPPPGWAPAPGWGYPPPPREPDNGSAVAGFVVSIVSAGLLLMSFGFLGVVSLVGAPFGIYYSRKGKRMVDEGKTPKHRGLAQAGFVIGIVTLVLSAIATIIGIIFIVALITDEEFRRDFENDGGGFDSTSASVALLAARVAVRLVA